MEVKGKSGTNSLFDHLNAIYANKGVEYFDTLSEESRKTYNQFMINRFISMVPEQLEIVDAVQKYNLSDRDHYRFYTSILPRGKRFNKYIKSNAVASHADWMIEIFCKHFSISKEEAGDYIDLLFAKDKDGLREIFQMYGVGTDELKKVNL